jgi:hypothetical protein
MVDKVLTLSRKKLGPRTGHVGQPMLETATRLLAVLLAIT